MSKNGFTLLEVVIVALIISILALFATMEFTGQTGRANRAKINNDLQQLKKAMSIYAIKYYKYPKTLRELQEGLQKNSEIKLPKDPYGGSYSIIHKGDIIYIGTYTEDTEELKVGKDQ